MIRTNLGLNRMLRRTAMYGFSSISKILDVKNTSMVVIQDPQLKLPYMGEVELKGGEKGVVIKIQETGATYLGMYAQFGANRNDQIQVSKVTKNWKDSVKTLAEQIQANNLKGTILDINANKIQQFSQRGLSKESHQQQSFITNGSKRRLTSSSPVLNICHDLYYGDMVNFVGCRGSKKSELSWNLAKEFVESSRNNLAIYLNPNLKQVKQFAQICPQSISFSVGQSQRPTDAGVYMLALKAIQLSIELKNKGRNVLLVVDNLNDIMIREWSLLQSIKFNSKAVDSSKLFQYNSLKIAPVSILNEIYSNCQDRYSLSNRVNHRDKTNQNSLKNNSSLTSILISEKQTNQLVQEMTTFSNNLKHLQTLSKVIEFPLNFKINSNLYFPQPRNQLEFNQLQNQNGFQHKYLCSYFRNYINTYLNEKNSTELKRQLYKNDINQAPWDYFFILDADWVLTGIKQIPEIVKSSSQLTSFLKWLAFNIQQDLVGNWTISAKQSYVNFLNHLNSQPNTIDTEQTQPKQLSEEDMQEYVENARMDGLINPFKKDYLS